MTNELTVVGAVRLPSYNTPDPSKQRLKTIGGDMVQCGISGLLLPKSLCSSY